MKLMNKVFCTLATVFVFGSTSLVAVELSAKQIIYQSQSYLSSLNKYAFDAVILNTYTAEDGEVSQSKQQISVKLERPDRLRVDIKSDFKDRTNFLKNGKYTIVDRTFGYYGQLKVPKKIDDALDFLIKEFGINAPLTALLYLDMPQRTKFTSSKNFGIVDLAGVPCHYVAFKNAKSEVHIWIATGDKPLVKHYSVISPMGKEFLRIDSSITWKDASTIKESDFVFTPSKNLMKISIESAR